MTKIKQIMPADGWIAEYEEGSKEPLVAWALYEDEYGTGFVSGLVTSDGVVELCDEVANFRRYVRGNPNA